MNVTRLQASFMLRLVAMLAGLGIVFILSLNVHLRSLMRSEVSDKAVLIFANLTAVQEYVRETLRPTMYAHLPQGEFLIEAMSTSFVTRKVMDDLNQARDRYTYRRVALDPRNPDFAADNLEREFIARFREDPSLENIQEFRKVNGQEHFLVARPVVFAASCLTCHGHPQDAPKELLTRYGAERGFGRVEGEIGGVDMVSLPVARESEIIRQTLMVFILAVAGGTALVLGFIYIFFDRAVAHSLARLREALRRHFPVETDKAMSAGFPTGGGAGAQSPGGQIEQAITAVEVFAGNLSQARSELQDYAANLETRVGERTEALQDEARARSADVRMFVDVLDAFGTHDNRAMLLSAAMQAIVRRFGASQASFVCLVSNQQHHSWPPGVEKPALPHGWQAQILSGDALYEPGRAIVPVQTPDTVRAVLILSWDSAEGEQHPELPVQSRTVLLAAGRQLGMALENLDAVDSLMRQKDILESVFEGIEDPLFLLDQDRRVLLANASATALAQRHDLGAAGLLGVKPQGPGETAREAQFSDGRSFSVRTYGLRGFDAAGDGERAGRSVVYARENTDEKRMLARMQQHEKASAVAMLAAGLAHEINNPLGVILCYARLLERQVLDSQARQDLDIIVRHTSQAQKVLGDLLNFARPKHAALGPVRLDSVAETMLRIFQPQASNRGVTLEADTSPGLPPVTADESSIEQILANLIINALDAVEAAADGQNNRKVRVSARPVTSAAGHAEVLLRVSDTGPGIPQENLARIFDPFFSTKEVGKGTGLGLAVVYGLVRDMGGRVEASNDHGAVFDIHLPAAVDTLPGDAGNLYGGAL